MSRTPIGSPTMLLAEVAVVEVERTSPSFVRVVLGGEDLAGFGVEGPLVDQRIKVLFPADDGAAPRLDGLGPADENWFAAWSRLPTAARGRMRTYTVREVRGSGPGTEVVLDFVVHGEPPEGAGAGWASRARPGDRLHIVAPLRGTPYGGREFDQGPARDLLLAGDESALPAVAGILRDLPATARGVAFVEVPLVEDVVLLPAPSGVDVRWLPRAKRPVGARLLPAVRRHLGLGDASGVPLAPLPAEQAVDVWETPTFSSSGEEVTPGQPTQRYAWIAGESTVVRTLRRTLVGELGWDRRQVCFMGYWRLGVAMRS